jgi:hypothetical protein
MKTTLAQQGAWIRRLAKQDFTNDVKKIPPIPEIGLRGTWTYKGELYGAVLTGFYHLWKQKSDDVELCCPKCQFDVSHGYCDNAGCDYEGSGVERSYVAEFLEQVRSENDVQIVVLSRSPYADAMECKELEAARRDRLVHALQAWGNPECALSELHRKRADNTEAPQLRDDRGRFVKCIKVGPAKTVMTFDDEDADEDTFWSIAHESNELLSNDEILGRYYADDYDFERADVEVPEERRTHLEVIQRRCRNVLRNFGPCYDGLMTPLSFDGSLITDGTKFEEYRDDGLEQDWADYSAP